MSSKFTSFKFISSLGFFAFFTAFGTAHADRLQEIKTRGSLICATLSSSVPLAYQDPGTRKYVGFDVDTCAAVAKHIGVQLDHRAIMVDARIPELALGRVDLVAAAMGYTKERAEQVAYTAAHYQLPLKIMVASDSGITKFSDLAGKKISANIGSTGEMNARRIIPTAEILTFKDGPTAFLALQQGKVQALAMGLASAQRFVSETGGKFKLLEEPLAWEATGLALKKGEPELLAVVNGALQTLETSGGLDAMWTKWFGPTTKFHIVREKKLTPISQLQ